MGIGMGMGMETGTGTGMGMRKGNGEPAYRPKQVAYFVDIAGCLFSAYRGIESASIFVFTHTVQLLAQKQAKDAESVPSHDPLDKSSFG